MPMSKVLLFRNTTGYASVMTAPYQIQRCHIRPIYYVLPKMFQNAERFDTLNEALHRPNLDLL